MDRTFILTAELDGASFDWLDELRRAHFPPERNLLPAHLTLFHRLSPAQSGRLCDAALPATPIPMTHMGQSIPDFLRPDILPVASQAPQASRQL